MYKDYFKTKIGILEIICSKDYLLEINYVEKEKKAKKNDLTEEVKKQLKEYFAGERKNFNIDFKLCGTDFQNRVLNETSKIPFGHVVTYKDIAIKINNPKAYRAIGNALNKNKIPIVVPCHRVIGTNGKLTGYAGGINKKEYLLTLEKEKQGF